MRKNWEKDEEKLSRNLVKTVEKLRKTKKTEEQQEKTEEKLRADTEKDCRKN